MIGLSSVKINVFDDATDTSGWAKFAGGSEKGSRYTVIDKATTFYGAQERCQKLGGYVVHINSLREQLFIEDFLAQLLQRRRQDAADGRCDHSDGSGVSSVTIPSIRSVGLEPLRCPFCHWDVTPSPAAAKHQH